MSTRFKQWIEMIRLRNRIVAMQDDRLPKLVYLWDKSLSTNAWVSETDHILQYVNMLPEDDDFKHVDLDCINSRLMKLDRERWWLAQDDLTKLHTFREVYDEQDHRGIVYANLSHRQRSLVVKLKVGILPLGLEIGRHTDVPLENRLCHICNDGLLDDEYHFILYCDALKDIRSKFFGSTAVLDDVEDPTDKAEICKMLLNSHNLRKMAKFLEEMYDERLKMLYNK